MKCCCSICNKMFEGPVEFEGLRLKSEERYFCSWTCYVEDTKNLYAHIEEVLKEAYKPKPVTDNGIPPEELARILKQKEAWWKRRAEELGYSPTKRSK